MINPFLICSCPVSRIFHKSLFIVAQKIKRAAILVLIQFRCGKRKPEVAAKTIPNPAV